MRTPGDIARLCLDYTDLTGDPLTGASDRQKAFLCSIITGAVQELYGQKPDAFRVRKGATLRAPVTGNLTATNGSTAVGLSAFGLDLRGCTLRYGGQQNQVVYSPSSPGDNLLLPWTGPSGTHAVTAFGDALLVTGFSVIGNVVLEGYGPLRPCADRRAYLEARDYPVCNDYGQNVRQEPYQPGQPWAWWSEDLGNGKMFLRVAPVPDVAYQISYDLAYQPLELEPADLGDTSLEIPVVGSFFDSILLPFVLQRWTGSPWFRNQEAKAEIARQFQEAKNLLQVAGGQQEGGVEFRVETY